MRIRLMAYAIDSVVDGWLELDRPRLADLLAEATSLATTDTVVHALDDGRLLELYELSLLRSELCIVAATGPRGDEGRWAPTTTHPVRGLLGPYEVVGDLHAPPAADPFALTSERPWLAMSNAVIRFRARGRMLSAIHETVLLNSPLVALLDDIEPSDLAVRRESAAKAISFGLTPAFLRPTPTGS